MKKLTLASLLATVVAFTACGGGGSSSGSSGGSGSTTPSVLTITSNATLPETVSGLPYSVTLSASNGTPPFKWAINPITQLTFPDGITIDAASGVISGNPKYGGSFMASVTDANSKSASKQFTLGCYGTLTAGAAASWTFPEYYNFSQGTSFQGGVPPITYSISSGALPKGVKVDSSGRLTGSVLEAGSFTAVITARDSWSSPQTASQQVNVTISPQQLFLRDNFQAKQLINQPIMGRLWGIGGTPPYSYRLVSGQLPPGVSLDSATGQLMGTPSGVFFANFYTEVKDSTGATNTNQTIFNVAAASGRNDSVQTATSADNGIWLATLSPYIDPPDKAPLAADTDYYKINSISGTIVNLSATVIGGPIDPVIEVLDGNAQRLSTCNVPDNSSLTFTSPCINDEDGKVGHDAALSYKVPGTPPNVVTSYIHVLDWRGDARPDMQYRLSVVGNIGPIYDDFAFARGVSVNRSLYAAGIYGVTTWTLDNGALPDGLSLSNTGDLTGIPTTDGDYTFRVKAVDSATPPQTFYIFATAKVVEPLKITSPAVWPNACVGQSYSYTISTSNGIPPLTYYRADFSSFPLYSSYGPTYFATPPTVGTFLLKIGVYDSIGIRDTQDVTLTVQNCP